MFANPESLNEGGPIHADLASCIKTSLDVLNNLRREISCYNIDNEDNFSSSSATETQNIVKFNKTFYPSSIDKNKTEKLNSSSK